MIHFELSSDDADVLRQTLMTDVSELRDEIAKTDSHDFRTGLKEKRRVLERVVECLEQH